jgi:hypothetical protein
VGEDITESLRRVQDKQDLQDLINRYVQLNDYGQDADELSAIFTRDAVLVGHFPGRDAAGEADLRKYAENIIDMKRTTAYRHHVSNILSDVDGDEATMTAFFILVYRQNIYEGAVQLSRVLYGNYDFSARRVEGRWLISRRVVHLDPM